MRSCPSPRGGEGGSRAAPAAREGEGLSTRAALSRATPALALVSDTPRLDAELLMAHALEVTRESLLLEHLEDPIPPAFANLLHRRVSDREPIAYITGIRQFWSLDLAVGPGVLIPRPDSETLLEVAIAHFSAATSPTSILDLGTGSAALLLAALAEWPHARVIGVERSSAALAWARANIARHAPGHAKLIQADWADALDARFDLILCNPPYVETGTDLAPEVALHEPAEALFAGPDGLACHRLLAPQLTPLLAPGGIACIEIGATQAAAATALFQAEGWTVHTRRDLAGRDRCLALTR
ncbi:MAG: peptide chain release factor N(5)-glutamine methyltransferase [Sphingomonadaceae bacterium]|nr:peptide chain release factor N(5)-glutamine methyltransferase [Sphingomonadaceae bacterium]